MGKSSIQWLVASLLTALCATSFAGCKSDEEPSDSDGGGSQDIDAGGGEAPDDLNPYCPTEIPPADGAFGPKGKCCYRTANSTRVEQRGDSDAASIEYRLQYVQTTNHPLTIGQDFLRSIAISRSENEEQSVLWRFTGPRKDGEVVSGPGTIQIGAGRYNCDGTYSYFDAKAAPPRDFSQDPARWVAPVVPVTIDATKEKPSERTTPDWDKNANRGYTLTPYLSSSTYELDWELVNQGFDIEEMPTDDSGLNCVGERNMAGEWKAGGTFTLYTPIKVNNTDPIGVLNGQTYCQLVAFGVLDPKEIDDPAVSCEDVERCEPGSSGCRWQKLPDSLCPVTDDEKKNWGCHIGYEDNPEDEPTNCTAAAPTGSLDPAKGGKSQGQCCDPLGKSTTLPECNAYFLRQEFVAAAAQITDDPTNEAPVDCRK
jgi:hypothetical protein